MELDRVTRAGGQYTTATKAHEPLLCDAANGGIPGDLQAASVLG
ncbi:MAG: hypothetical protein P8K78_02170 [Pirellulales bacterium]|nr:hypothetical protein [Pirellulales bacterium]